MASTRLKLPPLTRRSIAQLLAKAKRMGVSPGDYAKQLVEDGLAVQREAEKTTFAQIMKGVRRKAGAVDEAEIVGLVEKARIDHHRSLALKRKK